MMGDLSRFVEKQSTDDGDNTSEYRQISIIASLGLVMRFHHVLKLDHGRMFS